jgi:hypothetical protein
MIGSLTERHHLPMVAPAAILRGVGRVHSDVCPASFFRFAGQFAEECRPRGIVDALGKTMIVNHAVDMHVFDTDHPKSVYNLPRLLMGEVISSKGDTFVDSSYNLAMLLALRGTLSKLAMFALNFRQGFFFFTEKAGVSYLFTCGKSRKRLESHVNAYVGKEFRQTFRFTFYREGSIPLASTASLDSERFDLASHGAMQNNLDVSYARKSQLALLVDLEAKLRIGEAIVAIFATETGEAGFLTSFTPSEKGFKSKVNTNRNILQNLGMHTVQGGTFLFQHGIGGLLPIARERFALVFIGRLAHFKQVVIQPTAFIQGLVKHRFLLFRGINPILKHLTHVHMLDLNCSSVKRWSLPHPSAMKGRPIHPRLESTGLSGPSTVNALIARSSSLKDLLKYNRQRCSLHV